MIEPKREGASSYTKYLLVIEFNTKKYEIHNKKNDEISNCQKLFFQPRMNVIIIIDYYNYII